MRSKMLMSFAVLCAFAGANLRAAVQVRTPRQAAASVRATAPQAASPALSTPQLDASLQLPSAPSLEAAPQAAVTAREAAAATEKRLAAAVKDVGAELKNIGSSASGSDLHATGGRLQDVLEGSVSNQRTGDFEGAVAAQEPAPARPASAGLRPAAKKPGKRSLLAQPSLAAGMMLLANEQPMTPDQVIGLVMGLIGGGLGFFLSWRLVVGRLPGSPSDISDADPAAVGFVPVFAAWALMVGTAIGAGVLGLGSWILAEALMYR